LLPKTKLNFITNKEKTQETEKIDLKDWPVVTNGNDATLLDSSYFVFDMEVTGMNPKSDKIVEFGYAIIKMEMFKKGLFQ
jgi:DNA polymerase III alpha subunit (gram-positive type)